MDNDPHTFNKDFFCVILQCRKHSYEYFVGHILQIAVTRVDDGT